jgi:acyl carrier protein phosphodiesterase
MNFLAHLWLADVTATSPVGAILGDVVRGRELGDFPADIALGIRLHRHVDALTDRHPRLLQARAAFPEGARRYAGILLDLVLDHAMTRQWSQFSTETLSDFTQRSAAAVADASAWFIASGGRPPERREFADLLMSYASESGIEQAVQRIATRLRKPEALIEAANGWQAHSVSIAADLPPLIADIRSAATAFKDGQAT